MPAPVLLHVRVPIATFRRLFLGTGWRDLHRLVSWPILHEATSWPSLATGHLHTWSHPVPDQITNGWLINLHPTALRREVSGISQPLTQSGCDHRKSAQNASTISFPGRDTTSIKRGRRIHARWHTSSSAVFLISLAGNGSPHRHTACLANTDPQGQTSPESATLPAAVQPVYQPLCQNQSRKISAPTSRLREPCPAKQCASSKSPGAGRKRRHPRSTAEGA